MLKVLKMEKKDNGDILKSGSIVPAGTPYDLYSKDTDYIRVTEQPESFKSYREFLMALNRFVWMISIEEENSLVRRAQIAHGMDTVLTRNPFISNDAMEQHVPEVPDWF